VPGSCVSAEQDNDDPEAWLERLAGPREGWPARLERWIDRHQLFRREAGRALGVSVFTIAKKLGGYRRTTWRIVSRIEQLDWAVTLAGLTLDIEKARARQDMRGLDLAIARLARHRDNGMPGWPEGHLPWRAEPNRRLREPLRRKSRVA
jgi:hypothetical protein